MGERGLMRHAIIRVDRPFTPSRTFYVASVSRDGDFALTLRKARARRFTLGLAAEKIRIMAQGTRMQFSVCDAPAEVVTC